jgi:hypothetical protein
VLGALYVRTPNSRRKQEAPEQAEVHSQIVRRIGSDYGRIGTECLSLSEVTTDRGAENRTFAGKTYGARRIRTADLLGAIQRLA